MAGTGRRLPRGAAPAVMVAVTAAALVAAAAVGLAAAPTGVAAADLACVGSDRVGAAPLYDPEYVNDAGLEETLRGWLDVEGFGPLGAPASKLTIDTSGVVGSQGDAGVRDAADRLLVVAAVERSPDNGWRVLDWITCG